ncbi:hypothetical protein EOPP23_05305 [Endozoicomonas sp. OPT23]|nr:hypothetical protein [Endozoicomonas sp. OPT23]
MEKPVFSSRTFDSSEFITASPSKQSRLKLPTLRQLAALYDLSRLGEAHKLSLSAYRVNQYGSNSELIQVIPIEAIKAATYRVSAAGSQNFSARLQLAILYTLMTLLETEGTANVLAQISFTSGQFCLFYSILRHFFHSWNNNNTPPPNYLMQYGFQQDPSGYIARFERFANEGMTDIPRIIRAGSSYLTNIRSWLQNIQDGSWDIITLEYTGHVAVIREQDQYYLMLASGQVLSGDLETVISFASLGHYSVLVNTVPEQQLTEAVPAVILSSLAITAAYLSPDMPPWLRLLSMTVAGGTGWLSGSWLGRFLWQRYSEPDKKQKDFDPDNPQRR